MLGKYLVLSLLDRATALAAVTPSPSPSGGSHPDKTLAPATELAVKVGQTGEWFGPALVIALGLALDASAIGSTAKRDRVAAIFTYCGTLGFISIYGWADAIQGLFDGSWSWALVGSTIALAAHTAFVAILLGDFTKWTKRFGGALGPIVGMNSKDSTAVGKINTRLHIAAAIAAATCVLARGDSAIISHTIGRVLTSVSATFITWVIERLGG